MILCKCCNNHPHEVVEDEPVKCVVCGEMCQCEGCVLDAEMQSPNKPECEAERMRPHTRNQWIGCNLP